MDFVSLFLARRFFRASHYEKTLNIMLLISFITLLVSSCALGLVVAIMQGFEEKTYEKLQGVHPDLIIRSNNPLDFEKISRFIQNNYSYAIKSFTPYAFQYALLDDGTQTLHNVVSIMGIDPQSFTDVIPFSSMLVEPPHKTITELLSSPRALLIGKALADNLQLSLHDKINVLYLPEQETQSSIKLDHLKCTIAGIFHTGLDEFDTRLAICSLTFFEELFPPHAITQIGIKLYDPRISPEIAVQLSQKLHLQVYTWQELYPPLLSALKLEKYVATAVIALMILIASATLISLLFMYLTSKKNDIALLRSLGISHGTLVRTFMIMGVGLSLCASFLGIAAAAIISYALEAGKLIPIPDVYYVDYVPAHLTVPAAIGLWLFIIIISFCASALPVRLLQRIPIAQLLKS